MRPQEKFVSAFSFGAHGIARKPAQLLLASRPIPWDLSESWQRVLLLPDAGKLPAIGTLGKRSPEHTGRFHLKFLFFRAEPTKKLPELPESPDSKALCCGRLGQLGQLFSRSRGQM
jgi:hypothetical protein